jgi:hypothetical protein
MHRIGIVLAIMTAAQLRVSAAGTGSGCLFSEPVDPAAVTDTPAAARAFVSLAWVNRDFDVVIRVSDTTDTCSFNLNTWLARNKTIRTRLFSFKPGGYHVSFRHRSVPGAHATTAWLDTVVSLKAGTWYIARFREASVEHKSISRRPATRAKTWRCTLTTADRKKVVMHAASDQPAVKTIVLIGTTLCLLLFGGIMAYAR